MKIAWLPLLLMLLAMSGCGELNYYRVQQGDTLYFVSWRYGLDYRTVAQWNGLKYPYTIYDGQQLRMVPPAGGGPGAESIVPAKQAAPVVAASAAPPLAPIIAASPNTSIQWQWPAHGKLLQTFSGAEVSRKGIDIGGKQGQPVRAAAAGRVVYAGSGLLNYGKLIILKHNDNYLSAYAYNQLLRVREGDLVAAGQHIADMGGKGSGNALLHFEIRYDGRPMNPLKYLPPPRQ
jgi:lipoprotein NlpD